MTRGGPSRRLFLKVVSAVPAVAIVPWGCGDDPSGPRYLTGTERDALRAIANAIVPKDEHGPGAGDLGAVDYIEQLLSAFEYDPPRIHAAGPFSDRTPFPADDGSPSKQRSPNEFKTFVPLTRVQERGWRLRLYGSAGVPEGGPNDALLGPITGLRDLIRDGIAEAIAATGKTGDLDSMTLASLYDLLPGDARGQIETLVLQSLFALPEYGGNKNGGGWKMIYFEGDSMPLGYTYVDPATGQILDRPDHPVIGPENHEDPEPMDDDIIGLYSAAVQVLGGKQFY